MKKWEGNIKPIVMEGLLIVLLVVGGASFVWVFLTIMVSFLLKP